MRCSERGNYRKKDFVFHISWKNEARMHYKSCVSQTTMNHSSSSIIPKHSLNFKSLLDCSPQETSTRTRLVFLAVWLTEKGSKINHAEKQNCAV